MDNTVQSHRDLKVWQKAMGLAFEVYRFAARFPHSETCRLVARTTRAAASVPANIAEGHARATRRDLQTLLSSPRAR
jgi:four helix bundle protein